MKTVTKIIVNNKWPTFASAELGCQIHVNQPFERALGSDTFFVPFLEVFVRSSPCFSNFSSALGPIFKFLSMLGHNFFICSLWDYQNGVLCPL